MDLEHRSDASDAKFAPKLFATLFSETQVGKNFRTGDEETIRFGRLLSLMPLGVLLPRGIVVASANPDLVVVADRYVVSIVVLLASAYRHRHRLCLDVVGGSRQMVGDRPSQVHFSVTKVFPIWRMRRMSSERQRSLRMSDVVGRCAYVTRRKTLPPSPLES